MISPIDLGKSELMRQKTEAMISNKIKASLHEQRNSTPEEDLKILRELLQHQIELGQQIEELNRVQSELFSEKDDYYDLYNLAPLGYISMTESGIILEVNTIAYRLFGEERAQIIKKSILEFILEEDRFIYLRYRMGLDEDGQSDSIELRLVRADGSTFFVQLEARLKKTLAGDRKILLTLSDISERKFIEAKLKLREAHLTAIVENQPGPVWLKNLDGKFLLVNTVFAQLMGVEPKDVESLTDHDIFQAETAEKYKLRDKKAIRGKKQIRTEESNFNTNPITWSETFVRPIFNEAGEVIGTTGSRFPSFQQI